MEALLTAVVVASLLGSVHCAGMCGPFAVLAGGGAQGALSVEARYHLGRLISYATLGLVAGALGATMELSGRALGLQRASLVLAGGGLVAFGLYGLARQFGLTGRRGAGAAPGPLRRLSVRIQGLALRLPPGRRAWAIGLASGLLPCGWLYAYLLTATAAGSPLAGAAVMAVFWFGTVPALVLVGVSARRLLGPLERHAPAISSIALVVLGLVAIQGRLGVPGFDAGTAPADRAAALESVQGLEAEDASCCASGEAAPAE